MKKVILGLLIATSSYAQVRVNSFTVERQGGGQFEAKVEFANGANIPVARVISCGFRTLSDSESNQSVFELSGTASEVASAILSKNAIIAANASVEDPEVLGGTWVSLKLDYSLQNYSGRRTSGSKTVRAPMVVMNNSVLPYAEIEAQIRVHSKSVCK